MTVSARILLAEDDPYIRRAAEVALRRRGFTTIVAEDGVRALELARSERPDLILMDLLMPRLGGIEVLRSLRADPSCGAVPIIILTNSSRPLDRGEALQLGATDYLVKSNLSLEELGNRISALLEAEQ